MKTKGNELKLSNKKKNNQSNAHLTGGTGIVYKVTTGSYTVKVDGRMISCTLASSLNKGTNSGAGGVKSKPRRNEDRQRSSEAAVVVGDRVRLAEVEKGSGRIIEIESRRNKLSRRAAVPMPSAYAPEQIIAANVDQLVPVFAAANPAPKWNMLDRYLALAESLELPALIVITKLDLAQDAKGRVEEELLSFVDEYHRLAYPVILTSALSGHGLDDLREHLKPGLSVLLGKSGVGKTALLNAMQPGLGLRVKEISRTTGKGKHTTTSSEIFPLDSGGAIIDTPGVREFGLWDMDGEELGYFYREISPLLGSCRFGLDCQHNEEPGCAVRRGVAKGEISPRRYQSYLKLKEELGAQ
jgi:ribosome biogenesis GTPase / thiamine phosphate phosphatase